jgi:hypothetical protein
MSAPLICPSCKTVGPTPKYPLNVGEFADKTEWQPFWEADGGTRWICGQCAIGVDFMAKKIIDTIGTDDVILRHLLLRKKKSC